MFRKIFCVQICLLLFSASQPANGSGKDSEAHQASPKIMIIPYEPRMFLSDADLDISEYSELTPQQIRTTFRTGITEKVNAQLKEEHETYSFLNDLRPEAMDELKRIYGAIDYSMDTSFAILHPQQDTTNGKTALSEKKLRKKEIEKREAGGDIKFMNVKILDPQLLSDMNGKYGADVFVFLTQAEIKTKAKDCIDFQSKNYQREFKLHYAVYSKNGEELFGDVITVQSLSASNDINKIIADNFPMIAEQVNRCVSGN